MLLIFKCVSILIFLVFFTLNYSFSSDNDDNFNAWLVTYKQFALSEGISKKTVESIFRNVKFLDQVIKYDRKQPEFFEDTITYVNKRANKSRVIKANKIFEENKILFNRIENEFKG